jgi:hypothetical protein
MSILFLPFVWVEAGAVVEQITAAVVLEAVVEH